MTGDLVVRLLGAIDEAERLAKYRDEHYRTDPESWHTRSCGYGQGELLEDCDCEVPASVLRLCQAHRDVLDEYQRATARAVEVAKAGESTRVIASAAGYARAMRAAVTALARGYGLEEA